MGAQMGARQDGAHWWPGRPVGAQCKLNRAWPMARETEPGAGRARSQTIDGRAARVAAGRFKFKWAANENWPGLDERWRVKVRLLTRPAPQVSARQVPGRPSQSARRPDWPGQERT